MSYQNTTVVYKNNNWGGGTTASTNTKYIPATTSYTYTPSNSSTTSSSNASDVKTVPCSCELVIGCTCFIYFLLNLTFFFLILRWQETCSYDPPCLVNVSIYWIILPSIVLLLMIIFVLHQRCCPDSCNPRSRGYTIV